MSIEAKIIADSINQTGERLTTFIVTFPRIILAEFNTHRMFSRNSASSRAIPFKKMANMVSDSPFIPMEWQKDHSGMQGTEYLNEEETNIAIEKWLHARDVIVDLAKDLNDFGVTKQLCNRLLESFMYHTVIVTSTQWENFFGLRADPPAEIHIQKLAYLMLEEYNKSEPRFLKPGQWHIPFGDKIDLVKLSKEVAFEHLGEQALEKAKIKVACARCARVSYTVVGEEGKPDNYEADLKLHDRLAASGHWSAMEHCARAMNYIEYNENINGKAEQIEQEGTNNIWETFSNISKGWSGNFKGFVQYRKTFENECRKDIRVQKKTTQYETN